MTDVQAQNPHTISMRTYGGDGGDAIMPWTASTSDGGFVISLISTSKANTGNTSCSSNDLKTVFQKFNADGTNVEWTKCYPYGPYDSAFNYLFPASDGGAIFGGVFRKSIDRGVFICKTDIAGNTIWQKNHSKGGGSILKDMIQTSDGGFLMLSECLRTDTNVTVHYGDAMSFDLWVMKLDGEGNKIWSTVIGGSDEEYARKIIEGPSNSCYVIASSYSKDYDCIGHKGSIDLLVARIDQNGNKIWSRMYGGSKEDGGQSACADGKGGLIIAGDCNSDDGDVKHHIKNVNVWTLNIDSTSNIVWENCYGGGNEYPKSVCRAKDGSIWMACVSKIKAGHVDQHSGKEDAWFAHIDSVGNFLNGIVMGSSASDEGRLVHPLSTGFVLSSGIFRANDMHFSNVNFYNEYDAFFSILTPWSTSITGTKTFNHFNIYPNPATSQVHIQIEQGSQLTLNVYNAIGYKVLSQLINGNTTVNSSDWSRGVYKFQLVDKDYAVSECVIIN